MKIVMLAGEGISTKIVFNALSKHFNIEKILIEAPVKTTTLVQRRIKRLGLTTVLGQIMFKLTVEPLLCIMSKNRIDHIMNDFGLSADEITSDKVIQIESVNSDACAALLQELKPDLIVVNGTRIVAEKILNCIEAPFINMHAGITPKYRGVHGAYWAIANKDAANCGVTIHFVDKGIDTGNIIYQAKIMPGKEDNYVTYPFLQLAYGIELEIKAIKDITNQKVSILKSNLSSRLYYHPTLWGYLKGLLCAGAK